MAVPFHDLSSHGKPEEARALIDQPGSRNLKQLQRAFVVRAPDGISVAFGAPMAAAFQEVMPNSTLHFVPEAHGDTGALREGRIDLDIGSFRLKDPEIEITELSRQAQLGAVAAGHALGSGRRTAKRYAAQSHVAVMQRPREGSPVDDALAALGLRRFVALTVPSAYASLVVAARSSLVATVPERIARIMAPALGLTLFDLPFELARQPVVMAWHPRHSAEPAHTWLRQLVQRLLSDSTWLATPLPLPEGALPASGATHKV